MNILFDRQDNPHRAYSTTHTDEDGVERVSYTRRKENGHTNYTVEEYKALHPTLEMLSSDDYYEQITKPYLQSLQGDWQEITEERYWDMLEVLPPMKWTRRPTYELFFICEAYTHDLHTCCVQQDKKYYSALRSKYEAPDKLIEQLNNQLKNEKVNPNSTIPYSRD